MIESNNLHYMLTCTCCGVGVPFGDSIVRVSADDFDGPAVRKLCAMCAQGMDEPA